MSEKLNLETLSIAEVRAAVCEGRVSAAALAEEHYERIAAHDPAINSYLALSRERAFALGLVVSQRNMGLMVAATDGLLPGLTWLYFGLSQFPIYLSPQLLKPVVRKLSAPKAAAATEAAFGLGCPPQYRRSRDENGSVPSGATTTPSNRSASSPACRKNARAIVPPALPRAISTRRSYSSSE